MEHTGGFLKPEDILRQISLRSGIKIADFGCGHGYFSLPLAKFVADGSVYSIDVMAEALQAVKSKAEIENIDNIKTIRSNLEKEYGSGLGDKSMDIVVLANILFKSQKKEDIIKEASRVLKTKGELVVIDWLMDAAMAPKEGWLISKDEAKKIVETKGFDLQKELRVDGQHYGLLFNKI